MGEPYVAVLRIEPNLWRFEVLHYTLNGEEAEPLTIEKWQEHTSGSIVFNAGQCYPDLSYMGLLLNGDQEFGARLHPSGRRCSWPNRNARASAAPASLT